MYALDVQGRISAIAENGEILHSFRTYEAARPAQIAASKEAVFLLLLGEPSRGSAVVAYNGSGEEIGRWGTSPPESPIQNSLPGGGIAACAEGAVYYSYLNSPVLYRIDPTSPARVVKIGRPTREFVTLDPGKIAAAKTQADAEKSVAPLVRLGLAASRVVGIGCLGPDFIARQVFHPTKTSAVEIWDLKSERIVGILPTGSGVLVDSMDRELNFADRETNGRVRVEKILLPTLNADMGSGGD